MSLFTFYNTYMYIGVAFAYHYGFRSIENRALRILNNNKNKTRGLKKTRVNKRTSRSCKNKTRSETCRVLLETKILFYLNKESV